MPFNTKDVKSGIYHYFVQSLTQKAEVEKAVIHVENIQGPILLASGQDDPVCPSEEMGNAICERLKEKGFKYKYNLLVYKNAGHTLNENFMMGGTFEGNKEAGIDLTKQILALLGGIQN
jgi:dipeptidyl aminopeptidase/acylaminoacyl peptidase